MAAPLIVTLTLDALATAWFDALRTTHFPPHLLVVGAHVTMFHALPGTRAAEAAACIATLCATTTPFPVHISGTRFLGRGVAFALAAPQAATLRRHLAQTFAPDLTQQDRAPWSPHITVQNKVAPEIARQTLATLARLAPPDARAEGIALWRYAGGPWEPVDCWRFSLGQGLLF